MASQWPPKKNTAFTLYFTLYKNDGTIIANPGTITKKVSIDGAAVADITAAVTEEDTTYGQLSVVLASGEMNGDAIWVYIKDDTDGCVPFTCTLYTAANLLDDIKTETAAILTAVNLDVPSQGTAQSAAAGNVVIASGEGAKVKAGSIVGVYGSTQGYYQWRVIESVSTDTLAVNNWDVEPTGTLTYVVFAAAPASTTSLPAVNVTAIAADVITAASMNSDAGTEIATAVLAKVVEAQGSITLQQALQAILAATAGVVADATTSPILFKTPNGSRTTISAAVDGNGNRTSITFTFA